MTDCCDKVCSINLFLILEKCLECTKCVANSGPLTLGRKNSPTKMINITTVPSSVYVIQESFKSYQGHKRNQSNSAYSLRATCRCRPQPIHVKSPPGTGCSPPSVLNPWAVLWRGQANWHMTGSHTRSWAIYHLLLDISTRCLHPIDERHAQRLPPSTTPSWTRPKSDGPAGDPLDVHSSGMPQYVCTYIYIYTLVKVSTVKSLHVFL